MSNRRSRFHGNRPCFRRESVFTCVTSTIISNCSTIGTNGIFSTNSIGSKCINISTGGFGSRSCKSSRRGERGNSDPIGNFSTYSDGSETSNFGKSNNLRSLNTFGEGSIDGGIESLAKETLGTSGANNGKNLTQNSIERIDGRSIDNSTSNGKSESNSHEGKSFFANDALSIGSNCCNFSMNGSNGMIIGESKGGTFGKNGDFDVFVASSSSGKTNSSSGSCDNTSENDDLIARGAQGEASHISRDGTVGNFNKIERDSVLDDIWSKKIRAKRLERENATDEDVLEADDATGGIHFARRSRRATTWRCNTRKH